MNENNQKNNLFNNLKQFIIKNNKKIIYLILFIFIIFISFQFYIFNDNKKILNSSIIYNKSKVSNLTNLEFKNIIKELDNKNNFYSLLATMEIIKIDLANNDIDLAYTNYVKILDKKNLDNLYKAAVAIHGSYSILNSINLSENFNEAKNNELIEKVNNLISYIDDTIVSYTGSKLEILYLLSIFKNEGNNKKLISDESEIIFQQIQNNDKASSSIKKRVKKIHEFQTYK